MITRFITLVCSCILVTICHARIICQPGEYHQNEGYWLKADHIEAFVTTNPAIRLAVVRSPGQENMLLESGFETGLRTWVMDPNDTLETRSEVSKLPAQRATLIDDGVLLQTRPSDNLELSLTWKLTVNSKEDGLILEQSIRNHSNEVQHLAVWSLLVVPEGTRITFPLDSPSRVKRAKNPYPLFIYPYASIKDPRISIEEDHLAASVVKAPAFGSFKAGVISASGNAFATRENQTLKSHVDFDVQAVYPEGGPNLSVYLIGHDKNTFGELEHMSGLQFVQPGESLSMTQYISIGSHGDVPARSE